MDYQQFFLDNLGLIEQVVRYIGRRHHLSGAELDDFRGVVYLKLVEHDYAILQKFQGRSALATFLTTVISRIFLDERIARWGKWRPSAAARRLGQTAMWLEQLMSRDGLSFEAAVETLRINHHIRETDAQLAEIRRWLPTRAPRREAGDEELGGMPMPQPPVDDGLQGAERAAMAERIGRALKIALQGLEPQDTLILKMRFQDGFQVSQIARALQLEQKPLYRRIDQLLERLCASLRAEGLAREDVLALLGRADIDWGPLF